MRLRTVVLTIIVAASAFLGRPAGADWAPGDIACEKLTNDWPLWSALSPQPWSAAEIAARRYSDEADPEAVVGENATGAFKDHPSGPFFFGPKAIAIISRMLVAPTEAVCGDKTGEELRGYIDKLAHYSLPLTPPALLPDRTEKGFEKADPVIAAFYVVESSRFMYHRLSDNYHGYEQHWDGGALDGATLAYARSHWQSDRNPLWAVAILENSRDPADLTLIDEAVRRLRQWPSLPPSAQARYVWRLVAQYVRLQLVAGRLDEAAAARRYLTDADLAELKAADVHPDLSAATAVLIGDGIRWFLRRGEYPPARRWALLASRTFGIPVPEETKVLLAESFDELYGTSGLGLGRSNGVAELGPGRAVLDTLPASALIALSRRAGVSEGDRRAMVGAAWSRVYALNRSADLVAWLPDLRRAFPELAADIRLVEAAKSAPHRRRLLTRLMLKAPGLVAIPTWARPPGGGVHSSVIDRKRPPAVTDFDFENANDGNWWCAPSDTAIRANASRVLAQWALSGEPWVSEYPAYEPPAPNERPDQAAQRVSLLAEADRSFAAYPILRGAAWKELALLSRSGSASDRLAAEAIQWSREYRRAGSRADEGALLAETLALAVQATRHACQKGARTPELSKAAFTALHNLFPKSEWAERTPYWFGRRAPKAWW